MKGFRKFERGDIDETREDEIHYFIRMAECMLSMIVEITTLTRELFRISVITVNFTKRIKQFFFK